MLTVVKVGGRVVSSADGGRRLGEALSSFPGSVIVVHGGGVHVTALQERLDLEVAFQDGLRITSAEGVKAASMALSGWVNKRLVGTLRTSGLDAVGLSGEDGGLVSAFVKQAGRLGEVGTVAAIQPAIIEALLAGGFTPVISPISNGPGARPLNVNADEVAGALASALGASRLLLVSDTPGVVDGDEVIANLSLSRAGALLESGVAAHGMRVKLMAALAAASEGVHVRIGGVGMLNGTGGTTLVTSHRGRDVA